MKKRAEATGINFIGNVEGKDIGRGSWDVIVADGFVGNIALKTAEGIAKMLNDLIRSEIRANPLTMIGGAIALPAFNKVKKTLDYAEYRRSTTPGCKRGCDYWTWAFERHGCQPYGTCSQAGSGNTPD